MSIQDPSPHTEALAAEILRNVHHRECLISRLDQLHRESSASRTTRVRRLLYGIHNASLAVVETIEAWNRSKQKDWEKKREWRRLLHEHENDISEEWEEHNNARQSNATPVHTVSWNGENYLKKMLCDLEFLREIPEALSCLGPDCPFHRNPFLLRLSVDDLAWYHPMDEERTGKMATTVWKDVHIGRVRRAAFVLLLEEFHRLHRSHGIDGENKRDHDSIDPNGLSHKILHSAKFYPPSLTEQDLTQLTSLVDPPTEAIVAICCARLLLDSVGDHIANKLVFLTKPILLKIIRLPNSDLSKKISSFHPLHRLDSKMVRMVYPFVVHQRMDPNAMNPAKVPIQMMYLSTWLRGVVTREANNADYAKNMTVDVGKIFADLDARANRAKESTSSKLSNETMLSHAPMDTTQNDVHKANEQCKPRTNQSVQTDAIQLPLLDELPNPQKLPKGYSGQGSSEPQQFVPFPISVTVNLTEGSPLVVVNGCIEAVSLLKKGDIVRIYDARESPNWELASDPQWDDVLGFELVSGYDHSQIHAQEAKSRYDALNRLCYPYKKELEVTPAKRTAENIRAFEDPSRHVASDMKESHHSPLHLRGARIWKLIPKEHDTRPRWRVDYDDGIIPWDSCYAGLNASEEHFRVRVSLDMIEQQCMDTPYPLKRAVHQQRVQYFEKIPLLDVINEAFHAICRWHPRGTLIDNVKWAKLCRQMRFLSNMKNSKHEIDMAFVRHNDARKLDLLRFHSILDDIASLQHPELAKENALIKTVWSSIVTLTDVNAMMWKAAKAMALRHESVRVCAETRIAAFVRKKIQESKYKEMKSAALIIQKHMRQVFARRFVASLLKKMKQDEMFQLRTKCATSLQTTWRRFYWRNRFLSHQKRKIECERQKNTEKREHLRQKRSLSLASLVYRDVIRIDTTIATVSIHLYEEVQTTMLLKVYVPSTRETFSFRLNENEVRECLERALCSEGRLSWDEMLTRDALNELTKRLMIRNVRGRPIFLFSRRNIVEKGLLIKTAVLQSCGEIFLLSMFRSPHDIVFCTYQPSTRLQLRTKISIPKLTTWLNQSYAENRTTWSSSKNADASYISEPALRLLTQENQPNLIEWLVKRVVIRKNPNHGKFELMFQYEAEEEHVIKLVTKIQSQWRRIESRRAAKSQTYTLWEKIYVREERMFAYRNTITDERQWEKPKLLGEDDLADPVDEWRTEQIVDPTTGQIQVYHVNYGTGQSSWLTEKEAAILVQRRYRSKHESDLIGKKKLDLVDVVNALKFIQGARDKYDKDPNKLANIVNYALLCHCIDLDFEKARPIYKEAMKVSPNHPLIARAYGIYLLASCQVPRATSFQTACRLFNEADLADPTQSKFHSATEIYFRWAVIADSKNPLALLNFALLHQCIYKKYDHSERLYRAALAADPTNEYVTENYRLFTEERYPGGCYVSLGPPFSVYRRSTIVEERLEWAEWVKMKDPMCPKKGFETYFFNRFTKSTHFNEPDWKLVWNARVERSRCVSGKTTHWQEYYDPRMKTTFFYDRYSKEYTCERPEMRKF